MNAKTNKQLHWSQRVALVRHNLHSASRSGDFHFFKALQANGFTEGTNHVATLVEEIGDDADVVLAAMDDLNSGLAYSHQDAFKSVYDNLKDGLREGDMPTIKSSLYVDIAIQKSVADMAIDKIASSALALVQQQPVSAQEAAANIWITGATVVADCLEVSLKEMDSIESKMDDFIRLEASWNTVKASAICAVTVLKGIFHLMDSSSPQDTPKSQRSSSIVSASGVMLRRLSNAFANSSTSSSRNSSVVSTHAPVTGAHARHSSLSSNSNGPVYCTPNYMRGSGSSTQSFPSSTEFKQHRLDTIPHTPGSGPAVDDHPDPFDTSVPLPELPAMPVAPLPTMSLEPRMFVQTAF